ncbi:MAG: helix-turn-helix transcriptional regulator, partial [Pseudomonadota bacterium]
AAALGVTPTHLSRACKASTGRTAAELLTERTLYAARISLMETTVPIQDIARHLGFGSAAYFTRFMQQHTGQTPSALRQSARTGPQPARSG